MRFYSIRISNADGSLISAPGFQGLLGNQTYGSYVNGQTLPGAWNVELEIPVIDAATSQGFATARVWGVSPQEISQANDLNGKNIAIFGGMQKGLPLANPAQSGQMTSGTIFQAFGNSVGTSRTLDLVIMPGPGATSSNSGGTGTLKNPKNIVLNWPAGQPLGTAIQNALATAFPGAQVTVNLSANLVRSNNEQHRVQTLEQLAQFARETSFDIIKTPNYSGVSIVLTPNGGFSVFDGTATQPTAKQINFQDLIGQPTWINAPNISVKTVMRADLAISTPITLPQTKIQNTSAAVSSQVNQTTSFQGGFTVVSLTHYGNYRQASDDAWCTVIEAAPNNIGGNT